LPTIIGKNWNVTLLILFGCTTLSVLFALNMFTWLSKISWNYKCTLLKFLICIVLDLVWLTFVSPKSIIFADNSKLMPFAFPDNCISKEFPLSVYILNCWHEFR